MPSDLGKLRIDPAERAAAGPGAGRRWLVAGLIAAALLALAGFAWSRWSAPVEVQVARVSAAAAADSGVTLNATGYIVAAHKIQVGSKVVGKVAWIGVDKGDRVHQGQVIARLEDEEYRAQLEQARGQLASFEARLREMLAGSRPEEIDEARANLDQARADLENARIQLARVEKLVGEAVLSKQALDDARSRHNSAAARVASLEKRFALVRLGPRQEQIDMVRGQVQQARGAVQFFETNLANTVIRAPVTGTILERAVEKGEFVTTSFVGERGAKGYVVSLADLNDLEVELDISQSDFARLKPRHRGWVSTDAYPDRRYDGVIRQISPEANRQKATVQVKVQILKPDAYLRPDMNATVAFYEERPAGAPAAPRAVAAPAAAVRDGAVFVVVEGKAVRRGARALIGGEDVVVNPPEGLKDGARVRVGK